MPALTVDNTGEREAGKRAAPKNPGKYKKPAPTGEWVAAPWKRYDVSRVTWWDWTRTGKAPRGVKFSGNVVRWRLADLLEWERSLSRIAPPPAA